MRATQHDPVAGWVLAAAAGDARAWDLLVRPIRRAGLVDLPGAPAERRRRRRRLAADLVAPAGEPGPDPRPAAAGRLAGNHMSAGVPGLPAPVAVVHASRGRVSRQAARRSRGADQSILAADQYAILWQAFLRLSEWCQRVLRASWCRCRGRAAVLPAGRGGTQGAGRQSRADSRSLPGASSENYLTTVVSSGGIVIS